MLMAWYPSNVRPRRFTVLFIGRYRLALHEESAVMVVSRISKESTGSEPTSDSASPGSLLQPGMERPAAATMARTEKNRRMPDTVSAMVIFLEDVHDGVGEIRRHK